MYFFATATASSLYTLFRYEHHVHALPNNHWVGTFISFFGDSAAVMSAFVFRFLESTFTCFGYIYYYIYFILIYITINSVLQVQYRALLVLVHADILYIYGIPLSLWCEKSPPRRTWYQGKVKWLNFLPLTVTAASGASADRGVHIFAVF